MKNVELAQKVLNKVRKHPERHNQADFIAMPGGPHKFYNEDGTENIATITVADFKKTACGTTGCLAGWAAALTAPAGTVLDPIWSNLIFPDGTKADVEMYAIKALGITVGQANALFYCYDNETAIKRLEYLIEHPSAGLRELETHLPEPDQD